MIANPGPWTSKEVLIPERIAHLPCVIEIARCGASPTPDGVASLPALGERPGAPAIQRASQRRRP
jgi:hypothetical protein